MSKVVPELGSGEWIRDPETKLTMLFGHALVSDYSQSNIYHGQVTSIPFIIAENQDNISAMTSEMEAALNVYYRRYFSEVNVVVTANESDTGQYGLVISVSVVDNNKTYNLSVAGALQGNRLVDIVKEVNR